MCMYTRTYSYTHSSSKFFPFLLNKWNKIKQNHLRLSPISDFSKKISLTRFIAPIHSTKFSPSFSVKPLIFAATALTPIWPKFWLFFAITAILLRTWYRELSAAPWTKVMRFLIWFIADFQVWYWKLFWSVLAVVLLMWYMLIHSAVMIIC